MEEEVRKFLDYLQFERRRSLCTVDSYSRDLLSFCEYIKEEVAEPEWESVDADLIRNWIESMVDSGNAATSVNRRLSSLRTFLKYAIARGIVTKDPSRTVKGPKKGKPLPQYLRESEMNRLLDDTEWGEDYESVLAKTVITVFYSTGMRLSELVGLKDGSVDYQNSIIKVRGKRDKERIVPFGDELRESLMHYTKMREDVVGENQGALFLTKKGTVVTPAQVRRMVQKNLSKVTTMKKKSPHVLRHTFATAMLNNDSGLGDVQKLLGHASIATTEIYTHTTFEQLKKAYATAHPREKE